jgi:hypothetical protein
VKRVWRDKDDGGKRPIGMTAFEDKIAQRAVAMILGGSLRAGFRKLLSRISGRPQPAPGAYRVARKVQGAWRRLDGGY